MSSSTTCAKCGQPVAPGARYCPGCGADVSGQQGNVATAYVSKADASRATMSAAGLLEGLRHATLGEYEVMAELGRGGMATVYLAHDIALDRKVAIKVMSPHLLAGDGMVERFKREARTAASLSHPNIIPIYAVREGEHLVYFVMKFVEGRPLDSIIKEVGPLPIPMVQAILQQVGSALTYAHRRGIIHRDIKPANIMVDTDGWAVVTDFGIAKVTEAKGLTMTGATVGTPSYMSPEQCAAKELTGASDQYSLGIVAYEMLAGKLPFVAESIMAIMYAHFNEPPPPITEVRKDCPPDLGAALMRMLEKEPEKRFTDVDAAIAAMGGAPLSHDDPIRTQLMTLAGTGVNLQILKGLSTPVSPSPAARTPGKATAAATKGTGQSTRGVPFAVRPAQVAVSVGGAVQLTAARKSAGGLTMPGTAVSWASTEPELASVSEDGLVTALAVGTAVITCTAEGASATATVTVTPAEAKRGGRALKLVGGGVTIAAVATAAWLFGPWNKKAEPTAGPPAAAVETTKTTAGAGADSSKTGAPAVSAGPATRQPAGVTGGRDTRRDAAARNDSILRELRTTARDARAGAASSGATNADLAQGDAEQSNADGLARQGRAGDAIAHLSQAMTLWAQAGEQARRQAAAAAAAQPPAPHVQAPPPVAPNTTTTAAPADPGPLIDAAIQAYARALESGDVAAVRRAYPGMSAEQEQVWRDFFKNAKNIKVRLQVTNKNVTGDTAESDVDGTSQFLLQGKVLTRPLPFHASLARTGGTWRITTITQ
jgi:serine/threonine protein kinase